MSVTKGPLANAVSRAELCKHLPPGSAQPGPGDRRVGRLGVEQLDPLGAPGRRLPALAEVDPLADDLLVAELHDADDHQRLVVVADRVLIDPEVVAAGGAVQLELLPRGIRRSKRDDVRLSAHALAALRPAYDRVVVTDLGCARDLVTGRSTGGADVRRLE